jgi:hypothetical protein
VECGTRIGGRDTGMVVHVKKATEIRLDDLMQVSVGFFLRGCQPDTYTPPQRDGDISSSGARSGTSKLPEYASEYSD